MPFIKFTETRTTVEAEPQTFEAGKVYELPEASCDRWIRRGVAVAVEREIVEVDGARTFSDGDEPKPSKPAAKRRKA